VAGSLRRSGYPEARPLAAGVEGAAVYALDGDTVGKVWGPADLRLWQDFYADLAAVGLPFATLHILRTEEARGVAITVERRLHGRPLQAHVDLRAAELLGKLLGIDLLRQGARSSVTAVLPAKQARRVRTSYTVPLTVPGHHVLLRRAALPGESAHGDIAHKEAWQRE
jgi:hypothetical protein